MSATITAGNGAGTTSPTLILGYRAKRANRNIVRDLLGGGIAVVLIAPRPRSGDLSLFYSEKADAWDALTLHSEETSFALVEPDLSEVAMTYVVSGDVEIALDEDTRRRWVVTVPYQEVEV